MQNHMRDAITHHAIRAEGRFVKLPILSHRFWKKGLLVCYLLVKWLYYNRLYVLEPHLWPATNRSTHKIADLWPAHTHQTFCLYLVYLLSIYDVVHVISCTRPSPCSACNIEKLGMGLGTRLGSAEVIHQSIAEMWLLSTNPRTKVKPCCTHCVRVLEMATMQLHN